MKPFQYIRPANPKGAVDALTQSSNAQFIAGGTNLIDLMKRHILTPEKIIDISQLPFKKIEQVNNSLRIGALTLNTSVAENKLLQQKQPLLVQALNAGASAQIRNMATMGGNILQRTRCPYFYDAALPCNKRNPGSGCGALEGYNRTHAIFGFSDKCIAVHPSDLSVALAAIDATVAVTGPKGDRTIPFTEFHRLPGDQPEMDTNLQKGELVTTIIIPDAPFAKNVHYLKVRDRASYAFALISVAAALHLENNTIKEARLAMGGVAHKPWRLIEAEKILVGKPVSASIFQEAAQVAMQGAKAFEHNSYKLKLGPNTIVEALKKAAGIA